MTEAGVAIYRNEPDILPMAVDRILIMVWGTHPDEIEVGVESPISDYLRSIFWKGKYA